MKSYTTNGRPLSSPSQLSCSISPANSGTSSPREQVLVFSRRIFFALERPPPPPRSTAEKEKIAICLKQFVIINLPFSYPIFFAKC